jgi:hypothetical protein
MLAYCTTEKQRQVIELYIEHKSSKKVGEIVGLKERSVRGLVARVEQNAAKRGWKGKNIIPDGYKLKGRSTLLDSDGATMALPRLSG